MQEDQPLTAFISMLTSIFSATFAIITLKDIQLEMAMGASFVAMLSGCFAIRYYYLASKKFKKKK